MKKKFIYLFMLFGLLSQPVFARAVSVQAVEDFTTEKPPEVMYVKILEDITLDETLSFKNGEIVEGKIVDVTDPKRLKRNATFSFVPVRYKNLNGEIVDNNIGNKE